MHLKYTQIFIGVWKFTQIAWVIYEWPKSSGFGRSRPGTRKGAMYLIHWNEKKPFQANINRALWNALKPYKSAFLTLVIVSNLITEPNDSMNAMHCSKEYSKKLVYNACIAHNIFILKEHWILVKFSINHY